MAVARETVKLGLAARGHGKLKVRQPLRAAVVVAAGEERAAIERLAPVVLDELNVKELRFVAEADELGSYDVRPNYRALGPRFGRSSCRRSRRPSRRSIRSTSPRCCATAGASASTSTATSTSSGRTT